MQNYIQQGTRIKHTAGADISSGAVVKIGNRIGVAVADIANGDDGILAVNGVFELTKKTIDDMTTPGTVVYWDATQKEVTVTVGSNEVAGYVFEPAGTSASLVYVKINA